MTDSRRVLADRLMPTAHYRIAIADSSWMTKPGLRQLSRRIVCRRQTGAEQRDLNHNEAKSDGGQSEEPRVP
ncbi:MAG: hypothetical protein JXQ75_03295 [Phycisphaerae bacterium]|nr:hypothetical protein [Phycisphaerae bacterium]